MVRFLIFQVEFITDSTTLNSLGKSMVSKMKKVDVKAAIKGALRGKMNPRIILGLKSLRGRKNFDEVDLVYQVLSKVIKAQKMIDVGAHFGESLQYFLYDGWEVHAFEPDAANRAVLERVSTRRGRLLINHVGCSDRDENSAPFYVSELSSGISSLSSFDPTHVAAGHVDLVTLSSYIAKQMIDHVGFLKIDTEGHDLFVLRGFPWSECRPEVIVTEFEDAKTKSLGYDYRDLGDFLVSKGYSVLMSEWFPVVNYGQRHNWRRVTSYPADLKDPAGWGNFIATSNPEHADLLLRKVNSR
jgi:FkbM family methyltransferase